MLVLERQRFPRFSIGESLLANSMQLLDEAGMIEAVMARRLSVQERRVVRVAATNMHCEEFELRRKILGRLSTSPSRCRVRISTRHWRSKPNATGRRSVTKSRSPQSMSAVIARC